MFWRKKKSPLPAYAGCFGKLEATGDFVRHNAGGEELASFDRWMGGALDFAQRSMGNEFDDAYAECVGLFIFRGDVQGNELPQRGIVGAWAASRDSAGRNYPMVVFASYDYEKLVAVGSGLPIAVWPFLTAAYEIATQGRSWPLAAFLDRVQRMEPPSLDDPVASAARYKKWLQENSMKALWDTGFGSDTSRFWVVSTVAEAVAPFRGKEVPETGLAIRLPIGPGDAYATSVWTDLVLRLGGFKQTLLNTFWTPRKTAIIHIGPPHVGTLREIMSPTGTADHVAELCGLPTVDEDTARRYLPTGLDGVVARTDQPIQSFLEGCG